MKSFMTAWININAYSHSFAKASINLVFAIKQSVPDFATGCPSCFFTSKWRELEQVLLAVLGDTTSLGD